MRKSVKGCLVSYLQIVNVQKTLPLWLKEKGGIVIEGFCRQINHGNKEIVALLCIGWKRNIIQDVTMDKKNIVKMTLLV